MRSGEVAAEEAEDLIEKALAEYALDGNPDDRAQFALIAVPYLAGMASVHMEQTIPGLLRWLADVIEEGEEA